jgi:hypothetical protein
MDQKNKNMKILFYFFLILIFIAGCDPNCEKLLLFNNTKETIYYKLKFDTSITKDIYVYDVLPYDTVRPNLVRGFCKEGLWEYKINHESKDSTLHIFIFTTKNITNDIIFKRKFKRFDLKVKTLDSLKWIVTYK